ncbi:uncharacterized protein [Anabrus simplex]|uniref:uncharacterized protein isoform X2 n=1 Tax=Anabrus simplex TaxID=316456 RepID=UPI0035A2CAAE
MGTKRQYEDEGKDSSSKKSTGFWALGLISAMKDPNLIIEEDEEVVVIKDKYAKAKYHYLVLPKEDISSLNKVTKSHLPLLQHMHDVGVKMAEKHPEAEMRVIPGVQWLYRTLKAIWCENRVPEDWTKGTILPLFKKGCRRKCANYRGITLLSYDLKIIIETRLQAVIERVLGEKQHGFRTNGRTTDLIFTLRMLMEQ